MSGSHSHFPRFGYSETSTLAQLPARVAQAVQALAFWVAVVFPLSYVPLLGGGLVGSELLSFVALLAMNVLALTVGHDHAR